MTSGRSQTLMAATPQLSATQKALSVLFSLMLVLGCCVPQGAWAATSSTASQASASAASAPTADAASGNADGSAAGAASATTEENDAVDIAAAWEAGNCAITKGGTYYLSRDVNATTPLAVSAPANETVTIDFQGHTATVSGAVTSGIDVSQSAGAVVITDSTYKDENATAEQPVVNASGQVVQSAPTAKLVVSAAKVSSAVVGILANVAEPAEGTTSSPAFTVSDVAVSVTAATMDADVAAGTATSADAASAADGAASGSTASTAPQVFAYGMYFGYGYDTDKTSLDVTLDNVTVSSAITTVDDATAAAASYPSGEAAITASRTGIAYGIFGQVGGMKMGGTVDVATTSSTATCDLWFEKAESLTLQKGFVAASPLSVSSAKNVAQAIFATTDADFGDASALAASFTDATTNGYACSYDSATRQLSFAPAASVSDEASIAVIPGASSNGADAAATATGEPAAKAGDEDVSSVATDPATVEQTSVQRMSVMATSLLMDATSSNAIDLNKAWEAWKETYGPSDFRITTDATYYLSGDLDLEGYSIVVGKTYTEAGSTMDGYTAPNVTIQLNGHTLSSTVTGYCATYASSDNGTYTRKIATLVTASNFVMPGGSLTIQGAGADGSRGTLAMTYASTSTMAIDPINPERIPFAMTDTDVKVTASEDAVASGMVDGIAMNSFTAGAVNTISDSSMSIDLSNLTNRASTITGVAIPSNTATTLDDFDISIKAHAATIRGVTGSSSTNGVSAIKGGSITIDGLSDSSTAASSTSTDGEGVVTSYGVPNVQNDDEGNGTTITIANVRNAYGFYDTTSYAAGSAMPTLDGTLTVNATGYSTSYGIYSTKAQTSGMYILGSNFKATTPLSVFMGTTAVSNDSGYRIGVWADGFKPTDDQKTAIAGMFTSSTSGSTVTADDTGIVFAVDASEAAAKVVEADGTTTHYYKALASAGSSAVGFDNGTLVLLSDASKTQLGLGSAPSTYTLNIDLNGHTLKGLSNTSHAGTVNLYDSTGTGTVSSTYGGMIKQSAAGTLNVTNCNLTDLTKNSSGTAVLISDGATVNLTNVTITSGQYGVNMGAATLNMTDSTINGSRSSVLYGIYSSASNGAAVVNLKNTDINVTCTATGAASATSMTSNSGFGVFSQRPTLQLTATSDTTSTISAKATGTRARAMGVVIYNQNGTNASNASISLTNYAIATQAGESASDFKDGSWMHAKDTAIYVDNECSTADITLAGTFAANGEIDQVEAVELADSFQLSSGKLTLNGDVFAPIQRSAGSTLAFTDDFCQNVVASTLSPYAGDAAQVYSTSAPTMLRWNVTDGPVYDETYQFYYPSVASALNSSVDGASLKLVQDVVAGDGETPFISVNRTSKAAITFDLAGHTLEMGTGTTTAATTDDYATGAFDIRGAADITIKDSGSSDDPSAKGALTIRDGRTITASSGRYLSGISLAGNGAKLTLDGVTANVTIWGKNANSLTGATITNGTYAAGIYVGSAGGSVQLKDSSLTVATDNQGTYPYTYVSGIISESALSTDTVGVDAASSVEVTGATTEIEGVGTLPATLSSFGGTYYVAEVDLAEGTAFADEVEDAFLTNAVFDATSDNDGYGNHIYYMSPCVMSDGSIVFAFSDPVADEDVGNLDVIKPAHVYKIVTTDLVGAATGIGLTDAFAGTLDFDGSMDVTIPDGNAYGVICGATNSTATYHIAGTINVSGGTSTYNAVKGNIAGTTNATGSSDYGDYSAVLNVTDEVDGLAHLDSCMYPKSSTAQCLKTSYQKEEAIGVYKPGATATGDGQAPIIFDGAADITTTGGNAVDIRVPGAVYVTDGFSLSDATAPLTVLMGDDDATQNVDGAVFAKGYNGYTTTAQDAAAFKDVNGLLPSGSGDGDITWGDTVTVTFVVNGGVVQTDADVPQGTVLSLPGSVLTDRVDPNKAVVYEFLGWSTNPKATQIDEAAGDIPATASTYTTTDTMTYYAIYQTVASSQTLEFYGMKDTDGNTLDPVSFTAYNGDTVYADSVKAGVSIPTVSDYTSGTTTYKFLGWAVRTFGSTGSVSNVSFTSAENSSPTAVLSPDCIGSLTIDVTTNYAASNDVLGMEGTNYIHPGVALVAVYAPVKSTQSLVRFRVDNTVYGWVGSKTAAPPSTYNTSGWGSQLHFVPTKDSDSSIGASYTMMGWKTGNTADWRYTSDTDVDYAYTTTKAPTGSSSGEGECTLPTAADDVTYTAKFQETIADVTATFYVYELSSDGTYKQKAEEITKPYGYTDLMSAANSLLSSESTTRPTSFAQGGKQYDFVGWSLRSTDTSPLYPKDGTLPTLVSGSSMTNHFQVVTPTYYAIYKVSDFAGDVQFCNADGSLIATATNQSGTTAIDDAFASTGAAAPTAPEGETFVGWALTPDATSAASMATVESVARAQNLLMPFSIKVYPVFVAKANYVVTFYDADGTSVIKTVTVPDGDTVTSTGDAPTNPVKAGAYFTGWVDRNGNAFSLTDAAISAQTYVTATYRDIAVDTDDSGVAVSTSGMALSDDAHIGDQSITASFEKASKGDGNIAAPKATYTAGGVTTTATYLSDGSYSFGVTAVDANGSVSQLTSGFGTVTLTIPVSSDYAADHQYVLRWLKADGTVGSSAAKQATKQTDGSYAVTLTLDGYSPSAVGGNVVAFVVPTDAELANANSYDVAVKNLDDAYGTYHEGDYTSDNWKELVQLYTDARNSALDSVTGAQALEAADAGIAAMASIATDDTTEKERAKAIALEQLAAAYGSMSPSDYSSTTWAQVVATYGEAKTNVQNATDAASATQAGNDGVAALQGIDKDGTDSDSGTGVTTTIGGGSGLGTTTTTTTTTTLAGTGSSPSTLAGTSTVGAALAGTDASTIAGTDGADGSDGTDGAGGISTASSLAGTSPTLSSPTSNDAADSSTDDGQESGGLWSGWWPLWLILLLIALAVLGTVLGYRAGKRKSAKADAKADQADSESADDGEITFS